MARKTTRTRTAPKGRKPVPENENRRDKFERIGHRRMNDVLHRIRLLGNLSSPQYDCSLEDVARMRSAIERQMDETFARFQPKRAEARKPSFSFKQVDGNTTQH